MVPTTRWIARLLAVVLALGTGAVAVPAPAGATPAASEAPATSAAPASVEDFLDGLVIAPEGSSSGYSRDEFPHWIDNNGDCQDTRDEVLAWESSQTPTWDAGGCNVVSGRWVSAYDNQTVTSASDLSIDHMVALAEAWRSGASSWSLAQRRSFANDLSREESLRAVTISTNSSKGDRDPAEWLPPNTGFRCQYLIEWVVVKDAWDLTVDQAEYDALAGGLAPCGV